MSSIGSLSIETKEKFLSTLKRINSSIENTSSAVSSLSPSCTTSNFSISEKKLVEKSTNTDLEFQALKRDIFNHTYNFQDEVPFELNTSNSDDQISLFQEEIESKYNLCHEHKKYENLLHLLEKTFKKKKKSKKSKNSLKFLNLLSCIN